MLRLLIPLIRPFLGRKLAALIGCIAAIGLIREVDADWSAEKPTNQLVGGQTRKALSSHVIIIKTGVSCCAQYFRHPEVQQYIMCRLSRPVESGLILQPRSGTRHNNMVTDSIKEKGLEHYRPDLDRHACHTSPTLFMQSKSILGCFTALL